MIMIKSTRKGNFRSLREMFVYFVCCGPVRYIEDKEIEVYYSQKDNFVDVCNASTRVDRVSNGAYISDVSTYHREAYPGHLNPFAKDNYADVITDHQGAAVIGSIADYPEYLNPFSDDDDDDGINDGNA